MFKFIALALFALGVATGVAFSDEIKGVWEDTPTEKIQAAAEDAVDFVSDKINQ